MSRRIRYFLISCIAVASVAAFASPVRADSLGQNVSFIVNKSYDQLGRSNINATLRHVGTNAYYYVDDLHWNELSFSDQVSMGQNIATLASEFDNAIHPREVAAFGSEPNPGVDNDPHMTILLEKLRAGTGGYFETINLYPKNQAANSNQREMVAVSIDVLGSSLAKFFVAHEFQHLISFHQKEQLRDVSEDVWLNETRSEYAVSISGFNEPFSGSNIEQRARSFMRMPSDSLTEWPNSSADYAVAAVFGEYITGRFGQGILTETLRDTLTGITSLNSWWQKKQLTATFVNVFRDWMVASYLNDTTKQQSWGYFDPDLRSIKVPVQYQGSLSSGGESAVSTLLKNWQPYWYEFTVILPATPPKAFRFDATSDQSQNFILPHIVYYSDGSYDVFDATVTGGSRRFYVINPAPAGRGSKMVTRIVIAASNAKQAPSGIEETWPVSLKAAFATEAEAQTALGATPTPTPALPPPAGGLVISEGALIKRNNLEKEMYVISGKYKRYLRPEVIALYGHLDPVKVIPVDDATFNSYATALYVRNLNDPKVYSVWPDGTKHWLNITAAQWDASGRDWNAIFTINNLEFNYYKTGVDITR